MARVLHEKVNSQQGNKTVAQGCSPGPPSSLGAQQSKRLAPSLWLSASLQVISIQSLILVDEPYFNGGGTFGGAGWRLAQRRRGRAAAGARSTAAALGVAGRGFTPKPWGAGRRPARLECTAGDGGRGPRRAPA